MALSPTSSRGSSGGGAGTLNPLVPTAVKTANYGAAAGDLVAADTSAGGFTVTLPTAPADKTQVGVAVVKEAAFAGGNFSATFATIACGGGDVLLVAGGAASALFATGTVVLQYAAGNAVWYIAQGGPFLPKGFCFGYDQITANHNVTATTEPTSDICIACAAHVFDGAPVLAQFICETMQPPAASGGTLRVALWEGIIASAGTEVGNIVYVQNNASAQPLFPLQAGMLFTPSAGSHQYSIRTWVSATTGTPLIAAGAGAGGDVPAYVRFTKV